MEKVTIQGTIVWILKFFLQVPQLPSILSQIDAMGKQRKLYKVEANNSSSSQEEYAL